MLAVVFQLVALIRALRIEDQYEDEYRKTVRWFIASAFARSQDEQETRHEFALRTHRAENLA